MNRINASSSLKELLDCCTRESSPQYQNGWREFSARYKMIIYQNVTRRCLGWRVSRLHRQRSDTVNDIVTEVFMILLSSLSSYREVEDERKFRLWLATVCNRAAGRFLQREFTSALAEADIEEFQNYIHGVQFDTRWELFENVVAKLRRKTGTKKRNLERDINIFLLYTWGDLSEPMILSHPCFKDMGHRVVDNVVNRMRAILR